MWILGFPHSRADHLNSNGTQGKDLRKEVTIAGLAIGTCKVVVRVIQILPWLQRLMALGRPRQQYFISVIHWKHSLKCPLSSVNWCLPVAPSFSHVNVRVQGKTCIWESSPLSASCHQVWGPIPFLQESAPMRQIAGCSPRLVFITPEGQRALKRFFSYPNINLLLCLFNHFHSRPSGDQSAVYNLFNSGSRLF